MTDLQIKFATEDDCEQLSEVIAGVVQNIPYYNDLAKHDEILKFQVQDLKNKISEDKYSVIIAIDGQRIIGFCLSRFDDYLIWLEWFGIVQSHRGRGISDLLLLQLDKTISQRKCHKIWCDCRTENKASIHILTNNGYRQLVTISNHWYNQDFILWEKQL